LLSIANHQFSPSRDVNWLMLFSPAPSKEYLKKFSISFDKKPSNPFSSERHGDIKTPLVSVRGQAKQSHLQSILHLLNLATGRSSQVRIVFLAIFFNMGYYRPPYQCPTFSESLVAICRPRGHMNGQSPLGARRDGRPSHI
jgi:hypothetical protein